MMSNEWTSAATLGLTLLAAAGLLALVLQVVSRQRSRAAAAESCRLEQQVAARTAQLTELAHHLQKAREDERARLARDLHDELGALLTLAKLDAARIRAHLAGAAPEALERLAHLVGTLDQVVSLKRRITEDLMPSTLVDLGLVDALEILAHDFADVSGIEVHCTLVPAALDRGAELTLYRLVQEALNNTAKHAAAARVWITLAADGGEVALSVQDDGQGFDLAGPASRTHGLAGMRLRVESQRGRLRVTSDASRGTCVQAWLPRQQSPGPPPPLHDGARSGSGATAVAG
jgi:signal transduction histidine kinase